MRELRSHGVVILLSDAEVIGIVEVGRCGELVDGFRSAFDGLGIAAVGLAGVPLVAFGRTALGLGIECDGLAVHHFDGLIIHQLIDVVDGDGILAVATGSVFDIHGVDAITLNCRCVNATGESERHLIAIRVLNGDGGDESAIGDGDSEGEGRLAVSRAVIGGLTNERCGVLQNLDVRCADVLNENRFEADVADIIKAGSAVVTVFVNGGGVGNLIAVGTRFFTARRIRLDDVFRRRFRVIRVLIGDGDDFVHRADVARLILHDGGVETTFRDGDGGASIGNDVLGVILIGITGVGVRFDFRLTRVRLWAGLRFIRLGNVRDRDFHDRHVASFVRHDGGVNAVGGDISRILAIFDDALRVILIRVRDVVRLDFGGLARNGRLFFLNVRDGVGALGHVASFIRHKSGELSVGRHRLMSGQGIADIFGVVLIIAGRIRHKVTLVVLTGRVCVLGDVRHFDVLVGDVTCLVDGHNGVFTVRRDDGVINQRRDDIFRIVFVGVRGVLIGEDIAVIILDFFRDDVVDGDFADSSVSSFINRDDGIDTV